MRILLVTPYSWSVPGGVNAHVEGLADALRRRGHQTLVLAPADGPVPPGVVSVGRSVGVPFNGSVARIAPGPGAAARARRVVRALDPDIVHVHEPFSPSTSLVAVLSARAPVVATFHASVADSRLYRVARPALKPLWNRLAARIAVSPAAEATVEQLFGPATTVIPNGVSVARFAGVPPPDPAAATVVFLGRLERRKGAHVLLAAAPALLARHPGARIVVAGAGPERAALEAAVPPAARDAVEFAGHVPPDDLPALAERATAFCFPSLGGESFGVVLLEAMASGRPVVASALPGYAAVARPGIEALLVPPGDPEALAHALARLLGDRDEAARLAAQGRQRAARYDWDTLAAEVEGVYRAALAQAPRTGRAARRRGPSGTR